MPFFGSVTGADGQVYTRTGDPNWLRNSNDHYVAASSIGGVAGGGDFAYAKNSIYSPTSIPTYGPAGGVSAASLGYAATTAAYEPGTTQPSLPASTPVLYAGRSDWWVRGADAVSHAGAILH